MKIYTEKSLYHFEFWAGARDTAKLFTEEEFDTLEACFEELWPDGMSETLVNDMFWFEPETLCEWLGYDNFEAFYEERTAQ